MAAITSAADGDWNNSATWTGGVVPGNGDTVQLNHNVTVTADVTVGSSPATGGTPAIEQMTNNRLLLIKAGVTLYTRGDIFLMSGAASATYRLDVEAGGGIEIDSSQSASPSTTKYKIRPNKGAGSRGRIRFQGTPTARCFLRSNAGGANGWIDRNAFNDVLEQFDATYTDFTRIGDATNPFWDFLLATVAKVFKATNCVFDACGLLTSGTAVSSGSTIDLSNSTWKNTANATRCVQLPDFLNSGTKNATGCVFDKDVFIGDGAYDLSNSYFADSYTIASRTVPAIHSNILLRKTTQPTTNLAGDLASSYVLKDGTYGNPHGVSTGSFNRAFSITDSVFEYTGSDNAGDFISGNNPATARKHTVSGNILLPLTSDDSPGKFLSMGGGANISWDVYHNTYPSNRSASGREIAVSWGESYAGYAGIFPNHASNLAWSSTSNRAVLVVRFAGSVQDGATPAGVRNNATWNGYSGTDGTGYDSYSAGTGWTTAPGTGDVVVTSDPFLDRTRRLATWDAQLGGPGTVANALAEIAKRNDPTGYNPAYNIAAAIAWVRDGWRVKDSLLHNAGHDGLTIGAMGSLVPLNASATVSWSLSGSLASSVDLAASATVAVTSSAALDVAKPLEATATVALAVAADGVVPKPLSSTGALVLTATANGVVAKPLAGSAGLVWALTAAGVVPKPLVGAPSLVWSSTADLQVAGGAVALEAAAQLAWGASAAATVPKPLAGAASLAWTTAAPLVVPKPLTADGLLAWSSVPTLGVPKPLVASAGLVWALTGGLSGGLPEVYRFRSTGRGAALRFRPAAGAALRFIARAGAPLRFRPLP